MSSIVGIVTLLASLAGAAPALAYVNWPGYLFEPGHSSLNSAATTITPANAGALAPAWATAFTQSGGFEASPVVYNGSIYIGGKNGVFYQLDETTGAVIHQITLGKETACGSFAYGVEDTATVAPDPNRGGAATVYVAGGNGTSTPGTGGIYLWALDASTLQPVWATDPVTVDTQSGAVGWASPVVSNGTISVGIASGCDVPLVQGGMSVFSQSDGASLGSYKTVPSGSLGGTIWSTPAASGSSTWVATGNAAQTPGAVQGDSFSIVRLQGATKQDIWTVPSQTGTDNDFGASPTLFTGLVGGVPTPMVGDCNKNGIFYALRSQSLSLGPVWTQQIASSANGNLCNAGAVWDAGANQLIMGSTQTPSGSPGAIQALSPDTGAVMWKSDLPCPVEGPPSEDGTGVLSVVTFSIQGNVCSPGSTPSLYLYDAHATVPNPNGFGPPAPQLLQTIPLGRGAFSQPAFADGYLFVATEGSLMAYTAPVSSPSPPVSSPSPPPGPKPGPGPTPGPGPSGLSATTSPATHVATTRATFNGSVTTGGATVTWQFQYGQSTHYNKGTPLETIAAGQHKPVSVSAVLKHLAPNVRYHFRLVASTQSSSTGPVLTVHGNDRTFKTRSTGKLLLTAGRLLVSGHTILVPEKCQSGLRCNGRFSITTTAHVGKKHKLGSVLCTTKFFRIKARAKATVRSTITRSCLGVVRTKPHHRLAAKFTSRPRTGQLGLIKKITLVLR